jgi:glycosyltransferase involved in cell wall biosynthesis
MHSKVSVIVAIYKSERYIEECVRSLFNQTLDEIEYVFVNDATPDRSISIIEEVLNDYPIRQSNVTIINLNTNGGVANARQVGINNATGEYIIHCDSDDWVDNDMYERLFLYAKKTNADIVGCNFRHEFSDIQYDFIQPYTDNKEENIRRLINGRIFPSLCTSLTKRNLIVNNKLSFPRGLNMGEDLLFNLKLYLHSDTIGSINWAPYHYRHTEDSSCIKRTKQSISSDIAIAGLIEKNMKESGLYHIFANDIEYRKFYSKLPLMLDLKNKEQYNEWLNTYPETNKHIWRYAQIDWKQKLILWLAANRMLPAARVFQYLLELQHRIKTL